VKSALVGLQIMTSEFQCVVTYVGPVSILNVWTRVFYLQLGAPHF